MSNYLQKKEEWELTINQACGTLDGCVANDHSIDALFPYGLSNVNQLSFIKVRCNFEQQFGTVRRSAVLVPHTHDLIEKAVEVFTSLEATALP